MNIKTKLIPEKTKRRSGYLIKKVSFFVDHDTGNPNSTARGNVNYFINSANDMSASAHIFIDDRETIMCVPCFDKAEKAWHVLYNTPKDNELYGSDANDEAIGLELCYFPNDKERTLKAYKNYIDVAVELAIFHSINPINRSAHFELDPTRKIDPNSALRVIGKTYEEMKHDILDEYNARIKKTDETEQTKDTSQQLSLWAVDAHKWVLDNKISDGTRPKDTVTREEHWTMIYRMNGGK